MGAAERDKKARDIHDAGFEETPARLAYVAWRNMTHPIARHWWQEWDWGVVERNNWPIFFAGWLKEATMMDLVKGRKVMLPLERLVEEMRHDTKHMLEGGGDSFTTHVSEKCWKCRWTAALAEARERVENTERFEYETGGMEIVYSRFVINEILGVPASGEPSCTCVERPRGVRGISTYGCPIHGVPAKPEEGGR